MILGDYLQLLDNYTFARNTIDRALVKCNSLYEFNLNFDGDTSSATQEELDLSEAWMWISATSIIAGSGEKKQIGGRSFSKSSVEFYATDKKQWMDNANAIFSKYGKPTIDDASVPYIEDGTFMWGGGFDV